MAAIFGLDDFGFLSAGAGHTKIQCKIDNQQRLRTRDRTFSMYTMNIIASFLATGLYASDQARWLIYAKEGGPRKPRSERLVHIYKSETGCFYWAGVPSKIKTSVWRYESSFGLREMSFLNRRASRL